MRHRTALLLTVVVLLAGCSGATQSATTSTPATTSAPTTTATSTPAPTTTATATSTPTATATPEQQWTPPQPPNTPTEDKRQPGRISRVRFVDTASGGNGSGFSDFDVAVYANTSMQNVDPKKYGTVRGEPYFLVYVNGKLVARTDIVSMADQKLVVVPVSPAALKQFDPGTLHVDVKLMDRDSEYDDVYGEWNGTVQYQPA